MCYFLTHICVAIRRHLVDSMFGILWRLAFHASHDVDEENLVECSVCVGADADSQDDNKQMRDRLQNAT